ncbi:MAG: transcriptional regulator [Patulibacter sp.]
MTTHGRPGAPPDEPPSHAPPPALADTTSTLDSVVHHPVRLGILTIAAAVEQASFAYLKETLGVTDGNLSRNVTVLEVAGLLHVTKGYEGRRPRTWVAATDEGRNALATHLAALRTLSEWRPPAGAAP